MDERQIFAQLTAEIFEEVQRERYPGEDSKTTKKINRALRLAEELVRDEVGYRPAVETLKRMRARRTSDA